MPRLLVEKGPDRGKSVTVAVGAQLIAGRDKEAGLQLSDTMASRRHFMIASKSGIFGLKDLSSANGTLVNGRQSTGAHRLQVGDSIQVGETLMSWLADETGDKQGGLIGQQIGGYRIEERLGRGAMGTVYKATQLSLGRTVALKVLSPDLVKDEKFCEMFVKEARAAGSLNHPNIIQVYDVGDEAGQYFFSMEYASKGSVLEELSGVKAISMMRAVRIIKDACSALDYAERKGLVHRDIKPDNLMVTEDSTVKLGDLGLAMSTQELQAEQDGVFGTPHYIAPEQAMGKPIDHRADTYALGATFYRILTGRTLYTGSTVKEILKKQVREPHTPITQHMPDCPQAIVRIIDRMLAKNPAERYQHASEIMTDLTDWESLAARKANSSGAAFGDSPQGLTPEQSQQLAAINANRKLMITGIVALVAILAAVFSVYWFVIRDAAVVAPNNSGSSSANNAVNTPANNGGSSELPEEVRKANSNIRDAMSVANFLVNEDPSTNDYEKAIATLETALAKNPKASAKIVADAKGRLEAIKTEFDQQAKGALEVVDEWEALRQANEKLVTEWKYKAASEAYSAFIQKYEKSENDEILKVVDQARKYFTENHPASVQANQETFEKKAKREVDEARKLDVALKVATVQSVLERVRAAEEACDDTPYKDRLTALAEDIERQYSIYKREAERAEQRALEQAFERASSSLQDMLEMCRRDIVKGDFKSVSKRTTDWKLSNADYIDHQNKPEFKGITDDLERRENQLTLEHLSLLMLRSSLPGILEMSNLLKNKPWPDAVADVLGGPDYLLSLEVSSDLGSEQWGFSVNDRKTATPRKLMPADLDTREKRAALCAALAHLITNTDGCLDKLMQPASGGGLPALVGVFAWMAELEAYEAAFPLIKHAYETDPKQAEVREYYAWGLLGKANALAARGDKRGAQNLINDLERNFADTRANNGRK